MPSSISANLESHLAGESLTVALLVKITRADAVVLGFTSHDQDITYSGTTYYASDALSSSAREAKAGTDVDNMDFSGVLQSSHLTEADMAAGLYDGARVISYLVNYTALADGHKVMGTGIIGAVTTEDSSFQAEERSLCQLLKQVAGEQTSVTCRAQLGDARCKVNMAGNAQNGSPIRASKSLDSGSGLNLTFASDSAPTGHYNYGAVTFTSGPNTGLSRQIKTHTLTTGKAVLVLRQAFPYAVVAGDVATLEAGCDKTFSASCVTRFANANNFHGEPDIPGNDKMVKVGRAP